MTNARAPGDEIEIRPDAGGRTDQPASGYRYRVLGLLILVYTFNFIDRQILGILAIPIKAELKLTDSQLGIMGGLAFAVVYSSLAIPIGWLADRRSRTWIMTISLAVWSGFTMMCGTATGFWQLFLYRMGVGVGEAGGVAPAYSLIADYFAPAQRARALAAYSFGIPIGIASGTLFGGLLAARVDWRFAFIAVGFAGLVLAPIFKLLVREPPRGGFDAVEGAANPTFADVPSFRMVLANVFPKRTFWLVSLGAAASNVCGYGVAFWLPSYFSRSFSMSLSETSIFYAAISLIGGIAGIWGGGVLADRFGGRSRSAYPAVPAVAFLLAMPIFALAISAETRTASFLLWLIPTGLNFAWFGPLATVIQHLSPASMRATTSAMFLTIVNLLGLAGGYYYFGAMSDLLAPRYGAESLRYAILSGLVFYGLAAVLLLIAARTIKKDWVDA